MNKWMSSVDCNGFQSSDNHDKWNVTIYRASIVRYSIDYEFWTNNF